MLGVYKGPGYASALRVLFRVSFLWNFFFAHWHYFAQRMKFSMKDFSNFLEAAVKKYLKKELSKK